MNSKLNTFIKGPVLAYNQYDGLTTIGLYKDSNEKSYISFWSGEDNKKITWLFAELSNQERKQVERSEISLHQLFKNRKCSKISAIVKKDKFRKRVELSESQITEDIIPETASLPGEGIFLKKAPIWRLIQK